MKPRKKKYVVWFHWRKCDDRMTVHWRNLCINVYGVEIEGVHFREKRNKRQPRLVMHGTAHNVTVKNDRAYIS